MESCHIYTQMERRRKGLAAGERQRERECVRDGEWLKIELASIVKLAVRERLTILG
jgi:hypothetical protein